MIAASLVLGVRLQLLATRRTPSVWTALAALPVVVLIVHSLVRASAHADALSVVIPAFLGWWGISSASMRMVRADDHDPATTSALHLAGVNVGGVKLGRALVATAVGAVGAVEVGFTLAALGGLHITPVEAWWVAAGIAAYVAACLCVLETLHVMARDGRGPTATGHAAVLAGGGLLPVAGVAGATWFPLSPALSVFTPSGLDASGFVSSALLALLAVPALVFATRKRLLEVAQ